MERGLGPPSLYHTQMRNAIPIEIYGVCIATKRLPEEVEAGSICRWINFALEFRYIKNIIKRTEIGADKTGCKVFLVKPNNRQSRR
jgi:hypothetical protein